MFKRFRCHEDSLVCITAMTLRMWLKSPETCDREVARYIASARENLERKDYPGSIDWLENVYFPLEDTMIHLVKIEEFDGPEIRHLSEILSHVNKIGETVSFAMIARIIECRAIAAITGEPFLETPHNSFVAEKCAAVAAAIDAVSDVTSMAGILFPCRAQTRSNLNAAQTAIEEASAFIEKRASARASRIIEHKDVARGPAARIRARAAARAAAASSPN